MATFYHHPFRSVVIKCKTVTRYNISISDCFRAAVNVSILLVAANSKSNARRWAVGLKLLAGVLDALVGAEPDDATAGRDYCRIDVGSKRGDSLMKSG